MGPGSCLHIPQVSAPVPEVASGGASAAIYWVGTRLKNCFAEALPANPKLTNDNAEISQCRRSIKLFFGMQPPKS